MDNIVVVYAGEDPPESWHASVFVAGPMPRDPNVSSWRPDALALLRQLWKHEGVLAVFVPEARDRHHSQPGYVSQLWEERWMAVVDVIVFWVPRDMQRLPGLNTNLEFGRHESCGRVALGLPPEAVSVHYLRRAAETHGVPVRDTLDGTVRAALDLIGTGSPRTGPFRDVPMLIWRTQAFQGWREQTDGQLISARVLWAWSPGPAFELQIWAMRVNTLRQGTRTDEVLLSHPGAEGELVTVEPKHS